MKADPVHILVIEDNFSVALTIERILGQTEEFSGMLIPFMKAMLQATEIGFEKMNKALKDRVEKLSL